MQAAITAGLYQTFSLDNLTTANAFMRAGDLLGGDQSGGGRLRGEWRGVDERILELRHGHHGCQSSRGNGAKCRQRQRIYQWATTCKSEEPALGAVFTPATRSAIMPH